LRFWAEFDDFQDKIEKIAVKFSVSKISPPLASLQAAQIAAGSAWSFPLQPLFPPVVPNILTLPLTRIQVKLL
jgi:hypothetical protein